MLTKKVDLKSKKICCWFFLKTWFQELIWLRRWIVLMSKINFHLQYNLFHFSNLTSNLKVTMPWVLLNPKENKTQMLNCSLILRVQYEQVKLQNIGMYSNFKSVQTGEKKL